MLNLQTPFLNPHYHCRITFRQRFTNILHQHCTSDQKGSDLTGRTANTAAPSQNSFFILTAKMEHLDANLHVWQEALVQDRTADNIETLEVAIIGAMNDPVSSALVLRLRWWRLVSVANCQKSSMHVIVYVMQPLKMITADTIAPRIANIFFQNKSLRAGLTVRSLGG